MYDVVRGGWKTPKGIWAIFSYRRDTSDWNTVQACTTEDEYGLAELDLEGVALDVGGHIGGVAVGLALDNPNLRVIAIEALPENAALLIANAEENGVADRVEVMVGAAGFTPGDQTMHFRYRGDESMTDEEREGRLHHAFIGNISLFNGRGPDDCPSHEPHEHVTVPVVTLAELPRPSFIKIDCEGGEWEFLRGDLSGIPNIRGEWHPTNGHRQADLTALLADYDVTYSGGQEDPSVWMGFRAVRRA